MSTQPKATRFSQSLLPIAILTCLFGRVLALDQYISPLGNDGSQFCTVSSPCKTLGRAIQALQSTEDVIWASHGEYLLDQQGLRDRAPNSSLPSIIIRGLVDANPSETARPQFSGTWPVENLYAAFDNVEFSPASSVLRRPVSSPSLAQTKQDFVCCTLFQSVRDVRISNSRILSWPSRYCTCTLLSPTISRQLSILNTKIERYESQSEDFFLGHFLNESSLTLERVSLANAGRSVIIRSTFQNFTRTFITRSRLDALEILASYNDTGALIAQALIEETSFEHHTTIQVGSVNVTNSKFMSELVVQPGAGSVDWSFSTDTALWIFNSVFHRGIAALAEYTLIRRSRLLGVATERDAAVMVGSFTVRIDARGNWWNDTLGPMTCCNTPGRGVPVTLLTAFAPWCLDPQCIHFSQEPFLDNSTAFLFAPDTDGLAPLVPCSLETLCRPSDVDMSTTSAVLCVSATLVALAACIFIVWRIRRRLVYSWLVLVISAGVSIVLGFLLVAEAIFLVFSAKRGNLPWLIGRKTIEASALVYISLVVFSVLLSAASVIVMFRQRQRGLAALFLMQLVLAFAAVWVGISSLTFLTRLPMPLDQRRLAEQKIELGLVFLPPRKLWSLWGQGLSCLVILPIVQAFAMWKALSKRDHGEIETMRRTAEDTEELLGTRGSLMLRGDLTLKSARRLSLFNLGVVVTGILTAAAFFWFYGVWNFRKDYEFSQDVLLTKDASQLMEDLLGERLALRRNNEFAASIFLAVSTVLLGLASVYLLHYRHYELMTRVLLGYWAIARWTAMEDNYNEDQEYPVRLPFLAIVITLALLVVVSFISGIQIVRFIRRTTALLAADIEASVDNYMEQVLQGE